MSQMVILSLYLIADRLVFNSSAFIFYFSRGVNSPPEFPLPKRKTAQKQPGITHAKRGNTTFGRVGVPIYMYLLILTF
jgi:hypothetical protein